MSYARIKQHRTVDKESLGVSVLLWVWSGAVEHSRMNKPQNTSNNDAPAAAYLRAVPDCSLSFVGHVFGDNGTDIKPVPE